MSTQLTLSVEHPTRTISVVYVAGVLDGTTSPRLARLLDAQLDWCQAHCREADGPTVGMARLVVDLAEVSVFGPGGLSVLRHAHHTARLAGLGLVLTGLTARAGFLPEWARDVVAQFDGLPSVDVAVEMLDAPDAE